VQYLTHAEYLRLVEVAHKHNPRHALSFAVSYAHGLRVTELLTISPSDIVDGQLAVKRLKGSKGTLQPICEAIRGELALAAMTPGLLFPWSRQWHHELIVRYANLAGIHPSKAHSHVFKHSCAMRIWEATHSLGAIQGWLGHKSAHSSVIYLQENDSNTAATAIEALL
jgi:integrase